MKLLNAGFGNMINIQRIVAVASPDSAPIKRLIQDTKSTDKLIDVSCGKKTKSVIITDSGHIILSSLSTDMITSRAQGTETEENNE